jgi:formylglycine-generating enzyme required for sulfatase activity
MIDSGSPVGHLSFVAPDPPRLQRPAPRRSTDFASALASGRWRPDLALGLAVVLAWPAFCCLCVVLAASLAHAADGAVAARQGPLPAAWPLRTLSPAEERALQPADQFKECASCPEMVVIPPGRFLMGSARGEGDRDEEGPGGKPFAVTIRAPYALGRYLITVGDYLACVAEIACRPPAWRDPGSPFNATSGVDEHYRRLGDALTNPSHPIVGITWRDAQSYISWLNGKVGLKPSQGYRLPSEAEWERGARGGKDSLKYFWGDRFSPNSANGAGQSGEDQWPYTSPVGSFPPNPYGLYDIAGNVWQWIEDCYHPTYAGMPEAVIDIGTAWETGCDASDRRVLRGGSWIDLPRVLRVADRGGSPPEMHYGYVGFRVARSLAH